MLAHDDCCLALLRAAPFAVQSWLRSALGATRLIFAGLGF